MKRRSTKRIKNIHLLPGANEETVRAQTRRRRSPFRQLLKRLAIVAAVLGVLFLLWNNWETVAPESVLDWADIQLGNGEAGEGYPYTIGGSSVVGMGQVGNYLAVLSDSSLQFFNASAGCVEQRPNTLNDPTLQTAGQYALVTELGGSRFKIESRRETVLEMNLQSRTIYASDLLSSGMVAVATDADSQSYLSHIRVYNKSGKLVYEYKSGKYLITNVSLAPAEGGALKSVLLLFQFSSKTPTEHIANEQLLYHVSYLGDAVLVLGDTEYWVVNGKNAQRIAYEGMEPIGYASSRKIAGLVMRRLGSASSGDVWLLNSKGDHVKTLPFVGNYRSASCRDTEFALLSDSTVFIVSEGEHNIQINTPTDTLSAAYYRDTVMLLTLRDIQQIQY